MNLALKIKDDKRIFFSYVKSKTKLKPEIGAIRGDDGKLSKDNEEAARIMNLAFQNVFVKGRRHKDQSGYNKQLYRRTMNK